MKRNAFLVFAFLTLIGCQAGMNDSEGLQDILDAEGLRGRPEYLASPYIC